MHKSRSEKTQRAMSRRTRRSTMGVPLHLPGAGHWYGRRHPQRTCPVNAWRERGERGAHLPIRGQLQQ